VLLASSGAATAQDAKFPSRAVTLLVPFPPGGSADALPRIVAEEIARALGPAGNHREPPRRRGLDRQRQRVSRPAGTAAPYSPRPAGPLAINGLVQKTLPYEPTAFVPVALLALSPTVLTVRQNFPANSAAELIAYARANPGKLQLRLARVPARPRT
jgi:tripartite-type tricarboxylate transporter receptor subunit TctC